MYERKRFIRHIILRTGVFMIFCLGYASGMTAVSAIPLPVQDDAYVESTDVFLTIEVEGEGQILTGSGPYERDSLVVLSMESPPDVLFHEWTGPDAADVGISMNGDETIYHILMDKERKLRAVFLTLIDDEPVPADHPFLFPLTSDDETEVAVEGVTDESMDGVEEMVILPQTGGMTVFFPVGLGLILITWGCGIKKKQ